MLIAIVEDNRALAEGVANTLRDRGHGVDVLHDGADAAVFLDSTQVDLLILDVSLPGLSGLDLLRRLRAGGDLTPVLMLTARGEIDDRIEGLDAGADDYLVKPFAMDELEARIRALLRRGSASVSSRREIGELQFDLDERALYHGEMRIEIPRKELAVLERLLLSSGRIVPKDTLLSAIYGTGAEVEDKVIEVYVSRLRKRLGNFGVTIRAARGLGYRMEVARP